jgi:hypothetical protein
MAFSRICQQKRSQQILYSVNRPYIYMRIDNVNKADFSNWFSTGIVHPRQEEVILYIKESTPHTI